MRDRTRLIGGIVLGVALMALGIRETAAGGPGPRFSYEIMRFVGIPEGSWWVNPYLLVIGAAIVVAAVAIYARGDARTFLLVVAVPLLLMALVILVFRPQPILQSFY